MLRSIVFVVSFLFAATSFASEPTFKDIFTPPEGDHSLYIISKIFGNVDQNVLSGEASLTGPELLGNIFGIFNLVILALGVLMVLYTVVMAVLNTAHHGKMMGEKQSASIWIPLRITFAMAMIIPKTNGYNMAQVIVMWLVVQGVGAADTLWSTALDYFEHGGSIGESYNDDGTTTLTSSYEAIYAQTFMGDLLRAATCVVAHNDGETLEPEYSIQRYSEGHDEKATHYIYFGSDVNNIDPLGSSEQQGYECGRMPFDEFGHLEGKGRAESSNKEQREITFYYAQALYSSAVKLVNGDLDGGDEAALNKEYSDFKKYGGNYIADMESSAAGGLYFVDGTDDTNRTDQEKAMDMLREGGWILAGNYYQVLSNISGSSDFVVDESNTPAMNPQETLQESEDHSVELAQAQNLYEDFWNSSYAQEQGQQTYADISRDTVEQAFANEAGEMYDDIGYTAGAAASVEAFINNISGDGATDPILRAANYGGTLMSISAGVIVGLSVTLPFLGGLFGWLSGKLPGETIYMSALASMLPVVYGVMAFLYLQGSLLTIYLPMVPFTIFVVGAVGWVFSVIEAMVAAPIVALGLTIDGHDVYGKAEPAIMLLINLFLRPSLMIVGYLSAILVTWLAVDLVNVSVLSALQYGGMQPDRLFGQFMVSFMYVGLLTATVTQTFGLINLVPDKVMRWLGDHSQGMAASAEQFLQMSRSGIDNMAKQITDTSLQGGTALKDGGAAGGRFAAEKTKLPPPPPP